MSFLVVKIEDLKNYFKKFQLPQNMINRAISTKWGYFILYILEPDLLMHISMFRRRGGTGKGAAFEHFCCPLSGEFDHKFCPTLWTFEFDRAEDWVLNSC